MRGFSNFLRGLFNVFCYCGLWSELGMRGVSIILRGFSGPKMTQTDYCGYLFGARWERGGGSYYTLLCFCCCLFFFFFCSVLWKTNVDEVNPEQRQRLCVRPTRLSLSLLVAFFGDRFRTGCFLALSLVAQIVRKYVGKCGR